MAIQAGELFGTHGAHGISHLVSAVEEGRRNLEDSLTQEVTPATPIIPADAATLFWV